MGGQHPRAIKGTSQNIISSGVSCLPPRKRAPFHRGVTDDLGKKSRLPAFHDDNIIDPDLAPYMSDEGSSGDEEMSIFATMNSGCSS